MLEPGTHVTCDYRGSHVGTVLEPGDDPAQWNGRNSERQFCENTNRTKVQYSWGIMHDCTDCLTPITEAQYNLSMLIDRAYKDYSDAYLGGIPSEECNRLFQVYSDLRSQVTA